MTHLGWNLLKFMKQYESHSVSVDDQTTTAIKVYVYNFSSIFCCFIFRCKMLREHCKYVVTVKMLCHFHLALVKKPSSLLLISRQKLQRSQFFSCVPTPRKNWEGSYLVISFLLNVSVNEGITRKNTKRGRH